MYQDKERTRFARSKMTSKGHFLYGNHSKNLV